MPPFFDDHGRPSSTHLFPHHLPYVHVPLDQTVPAIEMARQLLALLLCASLAIVQATEPAPAPDQEAEADGDCVNIIDAANEAGLSTLVAGLTATGLTSAVTEALGRITVFAPTNDAFNKVLEENNLSTLDLIQDIGLLTEILTYHVVAQPLLSTDLSDGQTVTTLLGDGSSCGVGDLTVNVNDDGVTIVGGQSSVKVVTADVQTCSAIVHVIDGVLLPCPL